MKKCRHCNHSFEATHGNQAYCCGDHKELQKANQQKKFYHNLKEFRSGFTNNYKLFEVILPNTGSKVLTLFQLNSRGFKPNCFYGKSEDEKHQLYYWVGEYCFSFYVEKEIQKVRIHKK